MRHLQKYVRNVMIRKYIVTLLCDLERVGPSPPGRSAWPRLEMASRSVGRGDIEDVVVRSESLPYLTGFESEIGKFVGVGTVRAGLVGAGPLHHRSPRTVVEGEAEPDQALFQGLHRIGLELGEGDVGEPAVSRPPPELHGPLDGTHQRFSCSVPSSMESSRSLLQLRV